MDETVVDVVRNVENVCRLCLSTDEPRSSVFADRNSALSLATKIHNFLTIEILANDKLSTSICAECLTRLNKWQEYKELSLRSQEKLRRCLAERAENIPHVPNIKTEPMDFDEAADSMETVPLTSDEEWESLADERNDSVEISIGPRAEKPISPKDSLTIKREALEDEEDSQNNTEIESICSTELLLNPMAVGTNKDDRVMEADSTQKLYNPKSLRGRKKKVRRGPSTHYRGARKFKQRCTFCQIYLHSKYSYKCHMERFHSGKKPEPKVKPSKIANNVVSSVETKKFVLEATDEIEEMIEDVEDELISLEKDAPLTPVQQNIISQLKTFSCYSCQQTFSDRRSTLNHIRQHMPDLRPYTCIACLTEFADRSIYKLHCGASFQCAMKIALVVPEHGTEKYFTCNMCLRPLSNRKDLLTHLSRHSDKQYEQLVGGPFSSPPKLKPMATLPIAAKTSLLAATDRIPVPYMNGDPARNNLCVYCGMIYKHKPNLLKHKDFCKKLPPEERLCHRCVHCGTTYLAFNKFQLHLKTVHKKRDLVCSHCSQSFNEPNDYIEHHRGHRAKGAHRPNLSSPRKIVTCDSVDESSKSLNRWSCALCPESTFPTRGQLAEHRKVHLKLKIYSCSICRRMFGRASTLESHMLEHESEAFKNSANTSQPVPMKYENSALDDADTSKVSINSDPGTTSSECHTCGKVFSSYHNLRRHVRNVHEAPGRYSCFSCVKHFKNEQDWVEHVEGEHRQFDSTISCPQCIETFDTVESLTAHRREIHGVDGDDPLACYICGKVFQTVTSLKIHRGHHFRVNSRLSIGNIPAGATRTNEIEDDDDPIAILPTPRTPPPPPPLPSPQQLTVRVPRARKSFPNASPARQLQNILQCQVCDDRFTDVSNLRKHLWDVHCARNKPEKPFQSERLRCELCTNVLPDEESLRSHMKWHDSNPILSNNVVVATKREAQPPAECDLCGKYYSSIGNLRKHKKRHKVRNIAVAMRSSTRRSLGGNGFTCNYCQKVFATNTTLTKHREVCTLAQRSSTNSPAKRPRENQLINPIRPKFDFDTLVDQATSAFCESNDTKKPVTCNLCRKILPSRQELYNHRARVHRVTSTNVDNYGIPETPNNHIACTVCNKIFSNLANMKQHFTKVHVNRTPQYRCVVDDCNIIFRSLLAKRNHEKTHVNVMYTCPVCPKRMSSIKAINEHIDRVHKANSYATPNKKIDKSTNFKKINLDNYVVKGAIGRQCPICKITYPNFKAMKIHYLKVHDGVV